MKHKLQKIKEESKQLATEISADLRKSAKELKQASAPSFKSVEDLERRLHH